MYDCKNIFTCKQNTLIIDKKEDIESKIGENMFIFSVIYKGVGLHILI